MELKSLEESAYIIDNYEHLNPGVFYTVTRTPGKGVSENQFEYFQSGCNCPDSQCTEENHCSCLNYGVNYKIIGENLILEKEKFGNLPVFECNFRCSCFQHFRHITEGDIRKSPRLCSNRNVQFGPRKDLEIFNAGAKGLGLKTTKTIPSGSFICEYAGEVISLEEARIRQKKARTEGKMNYIFILKEYSGDSLGSVTCIDPTYIGNIGRYINHSCQPNSAVVPVRVNNSIPWLCVFAVTDIEEDEEICYSYSGLSLNTMLEGKELDRIPCFCGTPCCKKYLPFED